MATIVTGTVPASEFALHHALESLPGVEFEIERIVDSGNDTVMPMLWVRGEDRERIREALEADPTVRDVTLLADFGEEFLYRMEWISQIRLVVQMLTSAEATILHAFGANDRWDLRVLYPDRDLFVRTHEFCNEHGIPFEVASIRDMQGEPAGRYGLTVEQYETLVVAAQEGYFSIPREITLEELAEEFDVSHQALSERIRRAIEALIEDTVLIGHVHERQRVE